MLFNPAIERPPLPQLRALRNAWLQERVVYRYERGPSWEQNFAALGSKPATYWGLEGLGKLAFSKKTDWEIITLSAFSQCLKTRRRPYPAPAVLNGLQAQGSFADKEQGHYRAKHKQERGAPLPRRTAAWREQQTKPRVHPGTELTALRTDKLEYASQNCP